MHGAHTALFAVTTNVPVMRDALTVGVITVLALVSNRVNEVVALEVPHGHDGRLVGAAIEHGEAMGLRFDLLDDDAWEYLPDEGGCRVYGWFS